MGRYGRAALLLNTGTCSSLPLRDWPNGYQQYRDRLHKAFMSQSNINDEAEIWKRIERAQFVQKGTSRP